ncbi:Probable indole-3-acetic acid-amido synthetase GH3.1 [Striga hermonthica]|uniref:Probable indole-3-acetic acid-amido synthetase GH3.1 n=1 Tax=Striga hermonthica TaxID=68872 RepID=A0A9N7NTS7_STRHE|nr:Probable indole-3-acetic acid-amido synthetase GH3.1 [Striga hermonthica]
MSATSPFWSSLRGLQLIQETTRKADEPLIKRIADGDRSPILCAQPISTFLISSGTSSGEPKLIPSNKDMLDLLTLGLTESVLNQHFEGLDKGKGLNFMFTRAETRTQGGVTVQTALTYIHKSQEHKKRIEDAFTSPTEAVVCSDSLQSMYAQMLCGLYAREQVLWVGKLFAYGLVRAIKFLEQNWQQLTHDIRTGSLDPKVTDPAIRDCMSRIARPNPVLADSIARECSNKDWAGIIPRIWPNAKYLNTIVTGPMAQYIPTLQYYGGGLPIVSMAYASSECFLGINLDPTCRPSEVSYTFMPFMAYFEFLPADDRSEPVDMVNVEFGKEYEVVVTTLSGLYRYRLGDIVRVSGFHNSAPKFRFVRRKDVVLNIDWENTKETELQEAVEKAARLLLPHGIRVLDYTSRVDPTTVPAHYIVYLELLNESESSDQLRAVWEECCVAMEESFNWVYRKLRDSSIGPLEIRVVKDGTFEEVMEWAVSRGASFGQFKVPRCVSRREMVELLDSRVVASYFRPPLPDQPTEPRY